MPLQEDTPSDGIQQQKNLKIGPRRKTNNLDELLKVNNSKDLEDCIQVENLKTADHVAIENIDKEKNSKKDILSSSLELGNSNYEHLSLDDCWYDVLKNYKPIK